MRSFRLNAAQLDPIQTTRTSPDELTRSLPRGFYSTFTTNHNGTRVLGLDSHLDRLYFPAANHHIAPSASRADLRLALSKLAAEDAPGDSRFRVVLSASDGTVYVIVQPFSPLAKEIYEHGVKVLTVEMTRHNPRLKDSSFITESQSAREKVGGDVFEVLLTRNGKIYEGMTSNFYVVLPSVTASGGRVGRAFAEAVSRPSEAVFSSSRGLLRAGVSIQRKSAAYSTTKPRNDEATLVTARQGILLGVTRRAVLRLARGQGMSILYRAPRLYEEFAEAFLTSSSRGIVPIVQIENSRVGQGRPGVWTKKLSLAYQVYVEERSEEILTGD